MVLISDSIAALSPAAALTAAVSTGLTPRSSSTGRMSFFMRASLSAPANTATLPSRSPAFCISLTTVWGISDSGVGREPRGLGPLEPLRGLRTTDHRGVLGLDRAQHRVVEEEPDRDEDLLVSAELEAHLLGRVADRVDRLDHEIDLPPVDPALVVDLLDERLVALLVLAEPDVDAGCLHRGFVHEGHTDLDRGRRDARRREPPPADRAWCSDRCRRLPSSRCSCCRPRTCRPRRAAARRRRGTGSSHVGPFEVD